MRHPEFAKHTVRRPKRGKEFLLLLPNSWIVVKFLQAYFYGFRSTAAQKHCLTLLSWWWWCKRWQIWCPKFPRNSNASYLRSLTRTPQMCVAPFRHCDTHRTRENCQIIFCKSSVLLMLLFIALLVMCSKSRPPSEVTFKATLPNLIFPCGISLRYSVWFALWRTRIDSRLGTGWGYMQLAPVPWGKLCGSALK
jgi:hypothetical protein